jgi:hypothetical protein
MSMHKKIALPLLGLGSLILSRIVFMFINDPEGPNLLIVIVLAAIIFAVSLVLYALVRRLRR